MTSTVHADRAPSNHEVVFSEYFPYTQHAVALPPDVRDGVDGKRHRVVVVGGGPTGLALAVDLAEQGIESVVIEADPTVCTGSRAGAFTRRTLEIMARLGVADEIVASGLAWNRGWTYHGSDEVAQTLIPDSARERFPATLSQLQNLIEERLVEATARHPGRVDLRWHSRVTAITPGADGVTLEIGHPLGAYRIEADWVVACDGGRSTIRQALGLQMEGTRHEGRYAIVDVRIDTSDFPIGRRWWFDPPSNPGGTLIMFRKPGGMLRFDYQLRDDESTEEAMRPEVVLGKVKRHLEMLGVDRPWEPVWLSLYRASALTLPRYRHGRVLFAGDAAHLVPIFGVRGMNSAIEDAHNIAWKLALRLRGEAGDALLDTYSDERVAAARENLRFASKGAEFMAPPSAPHRLMRDAVLSLCKRNPALTSLMSPRQHAANDYVASPLNVGARQDPDFAAGPPPGMVFAETPLHLVAGDRRGHLSELFGRGFTLLLFAPEAQAVAGFDALAASLAPRVGLRVVVIGGSASTGARRDAFDVDGENGTYGTDGTVAALYGAQPGAAYLLRPDEHVLARWQRPTPERVSEAIERVLRAGADAAAARQPAMEAT